MTTTTQIANKFSNAAERIDFKQIFKMAIAMDLKYCWSKGEFVTLEELQNMLWSNYAAFIAHVGSDEDKGIKGEISISSGAWTINLFWFNGGPQVQILFGCRFAE